MSGKTVISVLVMLTISPIIAIVTLVFSNPESFGEHLDIQSLLMMYMFAMITIPLWLTYLPSISETGVLYSWILSGLVSGSVTLTVIVLIYRFLEKPTVNDNA